MLREIPEYVVSGTAQLQNLCCHSKWTQKLKRLNHSNTSKKVSSFIGAKRSWELEVVMLFTCAVGTQLVFSENKFLKSVELNSIFSKQDMWRFLSLLQVKECF